jgi:hypothetical protein
MFTRITIICISAEIAEKRLLRKTRVCGSIRAIRGIPKSLGDCSKKLKGTIFSVVKRGPSSIHLEG